MIVRFPLTRPTWTVSWTPRPPLRPATSSAAPPDVSALLAFAPAPADPPAVPFR